jgi:hypothetical protein
MVDAKSMIAEGDTSGHASKATLGAGMMSRSPTLLNWLHKSKNDTNT